MPRRHIAQGYQHPKVDADARRLSPVDMTSPDLIGSVMKRALEAQLISYLRVRALGEHTVATYVNTWSRHGYEAFGHAPWPPADDAPDRLRAYMKTMTDRGLSDRTVRNFVAVAKLFYAAQGDDDVLDAVESPKLVRNQPPTPVTPAELEAFYGAFTTKEQRVRLLSELIVVTGLRLREALSLSYTHDELRGRRVFVNEVNGTRRRPVVIGKRAVVILGTFSRTTRACLDSREVVTPVIHDAGKRVGLDVNASRLRSTFAATMLAAGFDRDLVASNMGLLVGDRYTHRYLDETLKAYRERLDATEA